MQSFKNGLLDPRCNLPILGIYRSFFNNQTDPDPWYWIGLKTDSNDWTDKSSFYWTDGSIFNFNNWDSVSPANPCNYLEGKIMTYEWNTGACTYPEFCELVNNFTPTDFICAISL